MSRRTRLVGFRRRATKRFDFRIGFFKQVACNDLPFGQIAVAFVSDFHALGKFFIDGLEFKAIANQTRQHIAVARRFNFHFTQHPGDDDLNVLVVDLNALTAIDLLNLVTKVLLNSLFAGDTQNIVRHQWTVDQLLTGRHGVARVNEESFSRWHQVLYLKAAFAADDDGTLATFLITQFDGSVDLGHHRRVLWFTRFEDLSNTRQTTSNVRNSGSFTRCLRNRGTLLNFRTFFNRNVGSLWQVVHV